MYDYNGKLILVTGASAGLGAELARAYRGAGAKLALVARRGEVLEKLAKELDDAGQDVRSFPCDLSQPEKVPELVQQVVSAFGRDIDVVVHNAAMSFYGEVELTPFEEVRKLFDLNFHAGVHLASTVLGSMKKRGSGQIVWIGSGVSYRGMPFSAAYSSSKAAARVFCEALRNELGGTGVDLIHAIPGALKTEFNASQKNYSQTHDLKTTGAPADITDMAARILEAGRRQRSFPIFGRNAWLGLHLTYWAPWLLDRLFRVK
ncbi:MAG: hypothetical protein COB53_04825 [Elusimicrobia bacterium]|nr:MAG: hypothetical protein COB53_04825 [Elusimicrobiota bacterium]